ncbi:helix-turn-helix transcriptional regulator [Paraburkholderia hospita]|uniref:AraC family transcriptional regulator n=1 Tax=Paraburkholderia hospita TaxID=169430 RepID=A0AAN1JIK3_9BURK|nr:helix-turn-helix transcriptional regulator [Paraburkholderia hospita]AUT74400.1 AraC family transcriptional regulator [Paraburkholderia hospita]EIN01775.1 AraC family transcriptional regulator [Paraburkholderia hospita]OUL78284.1 AraC family transcriptional regulator [Paraburkholderia hospita]OUL78420.1 AraC family transcriptional regulator [Paraburkholderia hospita]SEH64345.1 transcriptional regulator, AraC family [Paraburkholderia hospita]
MLVTYYFPYVSMLNAASVPSSVVELIRNGHVHAAAANVQRLVDSHDDAPPAALLQLQGDLQLSLGMEVDADDSYREAQKRMRDDKDGMRFASCRNAGWQALFRYRYGTAMSCFMQIADHPLASVALRLDALFGAFGVLFSVGRLRDADAVLDTLEDLLDEVTSNGAFHHADGWQRLLSTVRFDVEAQSTLRSRATLSDHIYWQVGLTGDAAPRVAPQRPAALRLLTGAIEDQLLRGRVEFLDGLARLAGGERDAQQQIVAHAEWAGKQGIQNYQSAVRIEIVLASLAGGVSSLAESVLVLLTAEVRMPQSHRQLEYLYCLAKLRHLQGRSGESLEVYTRYALAAVNCIRDEAGALARYGQRIARAPEQLDDIGTRLPARYRRAYRYLLDNLERKDLSIREIAAQVGVTDRALQSAFKTSLGSTPTEIIRRLRMERIRAELEADDSAHEQGILATAVKWGVSNRSTLVNSYRREFNESPSDTLNR